MVGENTGMNLSELTGRLVGKEYELGKMDCFMLIFVYLRKLGIALPAEFRGWTLSTYKDLYEQDPDGAKELMIEFMDTVLPSVHPAKAKPGDILLLRFQSDSFLAINGGNAQAVLAGEKEGVTVVALRHYEKLQGWSKEQI